MEMGTLIFDIDGTICSQESDYSQAKPIQEVIDKIKSMMKDIKLYFLLLAGRKQVSTGAK